MAHLIEVRDLRKTYAVGDEPVHALDGVSASIDSGEFVAIMGASGSGKSTISYVLRKSRTSIRCDVSIRVSPQLPAFRAAARPS